jgi:hypothetical protein
MAVVAAVGSREMVDGPLAVRERLEASGAEVLAEAMNRPVQRINGGVYLRGLIEQGPRQSLEPMCERLGEQADYQSPACARRAGSGGFQALASSAPGLRPWFRRGDSRRCASEQQR